MRFRGLAYLCAMLSGTLGLLHSAAGQTGGWQVHTLENGVRVATAGSGLSFLCARDVPVLLLNLQPPARRSPAPVLINIDGAVHSLAVQQERPGGVWVAALQGGELLDAFVRGQAADITVEGVVRGRIALQGSGPAVSEALTACWQPAAAVSVEAAASEERLPVEVPAAQRSAIMRAAGFTQRGSEWTTCEGDDTGMIDAMRDLNGDGRMEALVGSYGSSCNGNTGQGFVLLTQQGNTWRKLYESIGIPQFFKREGLAWPDIEIGGPGANCFRFLRWNGREYVDGGTSIEGRLCTIEERFEPDLAKAMAQSNGSQEFGFMGRIPMRLGYYVPDSDRCDRPGSLIKFDRDRYWEVFSGDGIEAYETRVHEIIGPDEEGWLSLLPETESDSPIEEGEPDGGLLVKAVFPGRIEVTIQDTVAMNHCQESEIPSRFRR